MTVQRHKKLIKKSQIHTSKWQLKLGGKLVNKFYTTTTERVDEVEGNDSLKASHECMYLSWLRAHLAFSSYFNSILYFASRSKWISKKDGIEV